jgi:hypothetical protein
MFGFEVVDALVAILGNEEAEDDIDVHAIRSLGTETGRGLGVDAAAQDGYAAENLDRRTRSDGSLPGRIRLLLAPALRIDIDELSGDGSRKR